MVFPMEFPFTFWGEEMPQLIQNRTRTQLRQIIGRNTNSVIVGTCSSNGDATSLLDTYGMAKFADNEITGRQVYIPTAHTSGVTAGEKSWVASFGTGTSDATLAPTFTASTKSAGAYEMWHILTVEDIHGLIDLAVMEVTDEAIQWNETLDTWTEHDRYEYDCLSTFNALFSVEYASSDNGETLNDCDSAWDGATNVTVTADTEKHRQGSACNKLVVADAVASAALFATDVITETDCSSYDTIELSIYTDTAFTDSQIEFYLDDTAACASPLDTMSLPAIPADSWTRVSLPMTNPELDTAIISVGIGQASGVDVGACNVWIDYVRILKAGSRDFRTLTPYHWGTVSAGSTDYLKLTPSGREVTGSDSLLRLSGYVIPSLLSADTSISEVDPAWIIHQVSAALMLSHAKSGELDIEDRITKGTWHQTQADKIRPHLRTVLRENTRIL